MACRRQAALFHGLWPPPPYMAPMLLPGDPGGANRVFNHGKMQRDFTHIDDIVEMLLVATSHYR